MNHTVFTARALELKACVSRGQWVDFQARVKAAIESTGWAFDRAEMLETLESKVLA